MKVIIAGSRTIRDKNTVERAMRKVTWVITEIVSGGAAGVDTLGEEIAKEKGVSVRIFNADWNQYGKSAGPIRNQQMADYADALLAVWDGRSRGTLDMIRRAFNSGLDVYVHNTSREEKQNVRGRDQMKDQREVSDETK